MSNRLIIASLMSAVALIGSGATAATATAAAPSVAGHAHARVSCTLTSSHTCIRGGEFCPRASYGRSGWDAVGRRYVCKGDRSHPHWMRP